MITNEKKKTIRDFYLKNRRKIFNRNIVDKKLNENILSFFKKEKKIRLAGYFAVRGEVSVNQAMCELNTDENTICVPKNIAVEYMNLNSFYSATLHNIISSCFF